MPPTTALPQQQRGARHAGNRRKPKSGLRLRRRRRLTPEQRRRRKIVRRSILAVFAIFFSVTGYSIFNALTAPNSDTLLEKFVEWGRGHYLTAEVSWLENFQYSHNKPAVGGKLNGSQLQQLKADQTKTIGLQPTIASFVTPAAAGEGVYKAVETLKGQPVVQEAFIRPDSQHTSYLVGVSWINQKSVKFAMHPGTQEPGGSWTETSYLTPAQRVGLLATWNGGFRMQDANGGFYLDGRTVNTLVNGKASEIFYKDGSMSVGMWGRDATMSSNVVGVRQNLQLLVDNGQVTADVNNPSEALWGITINNADFVWRSGVGVTKAGDIVYAGGPAMSVGTLANVLQRAGAERAMELDINTDWVSFMTYNATGDPMNPTPQKLVDFFRPANRYFSASSRDFVAVYTR
jgi:hypothetical protein